MSQVKFSLNLILITYIVMQLHATTMAEVNIVTKDQWKGQPARQPATPLDLPVSRVIICHTASTECNTKDTCAQAVRNIQSFHINGTHFDDIGYNFLIGNDGNVYEGRGWDSQGAFAIGYNAGSIGLAFIGTYIKNVPSDTALEAGKTLIQMGLTRGKISEQYKLYGQNQLSATESPGASLYEIIKTWPHWSNVIN